MKKIDEFDTHWVARGRHIQLLSGVFQSAKYALRKSSFERFDIRHDGLMNQDYSLDDMKSDEMDDIRFYRGCHGDGNHLIQETRPSVISNEKEFDDPTQHTPQNFKKSKVMITLLLSQAAEWEIEKLANNEGFRLTEIIPFEDIIFSTYGYSRKRTYSDDIFPSSSSFFSTFSNTNNDCHPDTTSFEILDFYQREQWRRNIIEAWTFVFIPDE